MTTTDAPAKREPTVTLHIGDQTRTLEFYSRNTIMLEDRLGKDPLAFIAGGGGQTKFLQEAIFCGLARDVRRLQLAPSTVSSWLDAAADDFDMDDAQREILYAIARGRPKKDGLKMAQLLDRIYEEMEREGGGDVDAKESPRDSFRS